MNITDYIVTMSQNAEVETPSLFPFPFNVHMIFSCLALVFFIIQYGREKKPYQLIMGIAIPLSLVIRLSDSKTLFYAVGIIEVLLIAAAFISSIIYKKKHPETLAAEAEADDAEKSDDEEKTVLEEETTEDEKAEEAGGEEE